MTEVKIILIRHGKTEGNRRKAYIGKTEEALSEEGILELKDYQKKGLYPETDRLYVSPMRRCKETAVLLYPECFQNEIEEFREMDFGIFEGKNYLDLKDLESYRCWVDGGCKDAVQDGEGREDFVERVWTGFLKMTGEIDPKRKQEQHIVCIVHGGTIMALLNKLTGQDYFDFQVKNGLGYWISGSISEGGFLFHEFSSLETEKTLPV